MTMKMAALQPEEIIVNPEEASHEMGEKDELSKLESCGPVSPDGVDGLSSTAADESDESAESGSETEEEEEEDEKEQDEEAMPDGDSNDDLHALLAFSKSRLENKPQPPPVVEPTQVEGDEDDDDEDDDDEDNDDEDATSDNESPEKFADAGDAAGGDMQLEGKSPVDESPAIDEEHSEEKKVDADPVAPQSPASLLKDQAYYLELAMKKTKEAEAKALQDEDPDIELAMKKSKEAEVKALQDEDPGYLRKIAEEKVEKAQAKAKEDEEATAENVIKPQMTRGPARSENQELWALLNYSKKRLETGSTPQVKKRTSVRGDDMSVSSKLSKSSKRSLSSRKSVTIVAPIAVEGGPGDLGSPSQVTDANGVEAGKTDAPFPDVTDNGDASVDGSVSLESETKNSDESDNSDSDDDESSDEEEEEEDDLPDFLKDTDVDETDPEEAKMLYEAAKFKAASILSVSEEKLTDVQMLQAIAIAEDAARKGDEKFSTKRSLFKLNEAKIEDLKSFLSLSMSPKNSQQGDVARKVEREAVGWGIGKGRFAKKMGSVFQDFREKCDEIDGKKQQERESHPTSKEMFCAGMLDLKAQIDEYEKIVTSKGKKP